MGILPKPGGCACACLSRAPATCERACACARRASVSMHRCLCAYACARAHASVRWHACQVLVGAQPHDSAASDSRRLKEAFLCRFLVPDVPCAMQRCSRPASRALCAAQKAVVGLARREPAPDKCRRRRPESAPSAPLGTFASGLLCRDLEKWRVFGSC